MAEILLPSTLTSPGTALAARSETEASYLREIAPELRGFIDEVYSLTLAGSLTLAAVFALWAGALAQAAQRLPQTSSLVTSLSTSPIPSQVFSAATSAVEMSAREGLTPPLSQNAIKASLGLLANPSAALPQLLERLGLSGAEQGRVVGPSGSFSSPAAAEMMARTASTADFGQEMLNVMRSEGYSHKRWMTRYDSRVRETHMAVDNLTIPIEESFIVGGSSLRFPGDPMATDFAQVVNCRCVLVAVNPDTRHALDHPEGTAPWYNPRPL